MILYKGLFVGFSLLTMLVHHVSPLFMGFSLLTMYVLLITVPTLHGVQSAHCISAAHPLSPAPTESTVGPPLLLCEA